MLTLVPQPDPDTYQKTENQEVQKRFQLAKLLRVTEEMLVCAKEGEWEIVDTMERSRKEELTACFDHINSEDSSLVKEALATLMYLNEKITTLVKQAKAEVLASQKKSMDSRVAIANYQRVD